jgi:hypothetical protein
MATTDPAPGFPRAAAAGAMKQVRTPSAICGRPRAARPEEGGEKSWVAQSLSGRDAAWPGKGRGLQSPGEHRRRSRLGPTLRPGWRVCLSTTVAKMTKSTKAVTRNSLAMRWRARECRLVSYNYGNVACEAGVDMTGKRAWGCRFV